MPASNEQEEKLKRIQVYLSRIELAKAHFWYYCYVKSPDFYRPDRAYLLELCNKLEGFMASSKEVLIINLPPRFGKSRTAQNFVEWILGKDRTHKIMTGSYNETLSTQFAKGVRNTILEAKGDMFKAVYSDVFPETRIKRGDGAMGLWSLEGGYNNYLATSPGGTATGFGADLLIIDDLIKNDMEAHNEVSKEKQWAWFTNTMLSRLEEGGKIIAIMTRWATDDLAGRLLEEFAPEKVEHINYRAVLEDGSMLCEDILSAESCEQKKRLMGEDIFLANYQQEPIDVKGRLYTSLKTYDDIPRDAGGHSLFKNIKCYIDTADTGRDYLCSIIYGEYNGTAYVLDVLYTQKPMEYTEGEVARRLDEYDVRVCDVESNNGGRGFARNIDNILKNKLDSRKCRIVWFHQSQNKQARIISNATRVMDNILFPKNWKVKYPEYYEAMMKFQAAGGNEHDDAPDATTGVWEKMSTHGIKFNRANLR